MTFKEIQDEVIDARFKEGQRTSVKRWINYRYAWIWGHVEWPFKKVGPTNLTVTASDNTPTMPTDFGRVIRLFDNQGAELRELTPEEFDYAYLSYNGTGNPQDYKVVNGVLTLGPTPGTSATFNISYERSLSYYAAGTTLTAGNMTNDTDVPVFPSQYHFILVMGAISTGLKVENDPTWQPVEQEFLEGVVAMEDDIMPPDRGGNLQYGRDEFGNEAYV